MNIDTVVYYQVLDPKAAVYEINDYIVGVEQITITTLRNVVGGMSLEGTLTSRDEINDKLRGELDKATGSWGIRVGRVEIKAIDPPPSIQESMERQMKADREKRATILTAEGQRESAIRSAEGQKQAQILTAEGRKQAAILEAEADRQSRILRAQGERAAQYLQAQGEAKAIEKVFAAIKAGRPTPELLAYQYLQTLPEMAQGEANKVWMVPSDFGKALEGFTRMLGAPGEDGVFRFEPSPVDDVAGEPAGGRRRVGARLVRHRDEPGDRAGRRGRGGAGAPGGAAAGDARPGGTAPVSVPPLPRARPVRIPPSAVARRLRGSRRGTPSGPAVAARPAAAPDRRRPPPRSGNGTAEHRRPAGMTVPTGGRPGHRVGTARPVRATRPRRPAADGARQGSG